MNTKKLIAAAVVFAAAGSAFAGDVTEGVWPAFTSTKTRAEVVAELKQAQADGSFATLQQEYDGQYAAASTKQALGKTRAEVSAELEQSKADGSYAALHQEYQNFLPATESQYAKVRAHDNAVARNGSANSVKTN